MRILMVNHYFESHRGGIEIVAGKIAADLAEQGHEVCWAASDASAPPSGPLLRAQPLLAWNIIERLTGLPMPLLMPAGLSRLTGEVRRADAIIVHDGLYMTSLVALAVGRRFGKPALLVQHIGEIPYRSLILRKVMRLANRWLVAPALSRADQVVFISETVRRYFAGIEFRRPPLTLFNGIGDGFKVATADERADLRREFDIPEATRAALFVGRFVEKKGLAHIREAARDRPETLFLLAGWGPIDPRGWKLPNVRVLEGLSGPALARVYRAADVFVLPSVGEGLPLVLQEALASGLPVICGKDTAAADPEAGHWFRPIDVELHEPLQTGRALAEAIDAAPAFDPEEARRRSAFALERYSWAKTSRRYAHVLAALVGQRSGAFSEPTLQAEAA